MAKSQPPWFVRRDAHELRHAFFISHVAEDAGDVALLKAAISAYSGRGGRAAIDCFLDVHNWPLGNVSGAVIREKLIYSGHMIAWITPSYMETTRGWVWMELAFAELIELSMNYGLDHLDLQHPFVVPIFRGVTVEQIALAASDRSTKRGFLH